MLRFFAAFLLIIIFIYPAQISMIWIARMINKKLPQNLPLLPNFPSKLATSTLKLKHGHANAKETKLAVRGATIISGLMAAILTKFTLWIPLFIWVTVISILVSFVDED
ncbi:MAG: hypothetical protein WA999_10840 [Spirulinaceae cyanobacterium]